MATATREVAEEWAGSGRWAGYSWSTTYARRTPAPRVWCSSFDGGLLDETDLVGMVFPDGEILSAGFHSLDEVRSKAKPLLADRLAVALHAAEQGATALCEGGQVLPDRA